MENLRVERPCPVQVKRLKNCNTHFYCTGCQKKVMDFRRMNEAGLKDEVSSELCGIFTVDQLHGQLPIRGVRKFIFRSLAIFSLLGFNVKPVSAQLPDSTSIVKTVKIENQEENQESNKKTGDTKRNKRKRFRRKKKEVTVIGCPSF